VRTPRAAAIAYSLAIGLRFCGIVLEPPRPGAWGSNTSPTSVCISSTTSVANFAMLPHAIARVVAHAARRERSACHGASGARSPSSRASASVTERPCAPSDASVPTAPPNCTTRALSRAARSATSASQSGASHTAHL
jgi:hypothetical protein